jgi:hypothetical protein
MIALSGDPEVVLGSQDELAAVAGALRRETKRRYAGLASRFERRDEATTARLFRHLADEIAAVTPDAGGRPPPLPAVATKPWDDLAGSTLLTPYRALAQAVAAADGAFAYLSYLAARTPDPAVRRATELLAGDELRRAADLRRLRREAWRAERERRPPPLRTCADLARAAEPRLAEAALIHGALAGLAEAAGEPENAGRLRRIGEAEAEEAGGAMARATIPRLPAILDVEQRRERAVIPLERLFELFEAAAARAADENLLDMAQAGLARTTERIRYLTTA